MRIVIAKNEERLVLASVSLTFLLVGLLIGLVAG